MLKTIETMALRRAGYGTMEEFRKALGLETTAAAEAALMPYVVGYELWRVRPGETMQGIARRFGVSARALEVANPGIQAEQLPVGRILVVPMDFDVVPKDTRMSSQLLHYVVSGLQARYPMLKVSIIGRTAYGRELLQLRIGQGNRVAYYNAAHHANEWITTPLVMSCLERYLKAGTFGERILGLDGAKLMEETSLLLVPMVNPDGVDLVTGAVSERANAAAQDIAEQYPEIPFPEGWKANLRGVDLNLNYPARWDEAREIKYEQGFDSPAPRDFVGEAPLSEAESRAMFDTTEEISPDITIAWHTQGKEIYWKFLNLEPQGAAELGAQMAAASGYTLEEVPYSSSFAGYKDWFIQDFDRPGYTIEAGSGENPLPMEQLGEMITDNLPIFLLGLTGPLPVNGAEQTAARSEQASAPVREPAQVSPQNEAVAVYGRGNMAMKESPAQPALAVRQTTAGQRNMLPGNVDPMNTGWG